MFTVRRSDHNPLLSPREEHPWEAIGAYNPSVVAEKGGVRVFYRAVSHPMALVTPYAGQSSIGSAFSKDGVHFEDRKQVLMGSEVYDAFGCEDPRATFFEGKWYVFYTALGGFPFSAGNIKVAVAVGDAPDALHEKHLVTPFNAKAATLFPSRINGEVVLLLTVHTDYTPEHPRPTIALAKAKNIEDFWNESYWKPWYEKLADHALPDFRRTDDDHMEVGAPPILTEKGWVLLYSYIQHYYDEGRRIFGVEAALLDAGNPQKILGRTDTLLVPEEDYEHHGIVPHIVFPSGALLTGDALDLYYGGADTVSAKASMRLSDVLKSLSGDTKLREFSRCNNNPILSALPAHAWEKRAVFNPAAIDLDGSVHLLYRAMGDDNTSVMGYARSKDGTHIDERLPSPAYIPRAEFESKKGTPNGNSGCEDPRLTLLDGRIYLTYTAYDGVHAPRGAISSITPADFAAKKFDAWTPPVLVTPDDVDDKDVCLLPETVNGKRILFHRISGRICADLLTDLNFKTRATGRIEILAPRAGMWDSKKIGMAGPPIKVDGGYLLIYHGISENGTYRLGAAFLAPDGISVLARGADPIFEPKEHYEREGQVGNVVFSCGAVVRGDTLYLYYGGADSVVGVATGSISKLVAQLKA
jgi:predicted GH43/DUF377 family glycosyl hydrolase